MPDTDFAATVEHFASRLAAEHVALAALWLERLHQVLDVARAEVFPTPQLLDHIPELINEIAVYLRAPMTDRHQDADGRRGRRYRWNILCPA
jgi:hypothetical protein